MPILNYKGEDGQFHSLGGLLKGDPGNDGVVIGDTEPTDPSVKVWINSAGDPMTAEQVPVSSTDNSSVATALGNKVPSSRTINGKPLNSDVVLMASDLEGAAADSNKLGGKDPKYYIQPRNLLDNSDFRNPVNQRGLTTYNYQWQYTIDRWIFASVSTDGAPSFDITDSGITITNTTGNIYFLQRVPKALITSGNTYTLAYQISDGTIVVTTATNFEEIGGESYQVVYVIPSGATIVWASLYEGTYTADTLPPYVPKGYEEELFNCLYFFQRHTFSQYQTICTSYQGPEYCFLNFPLYRGMRGFANVTQTGGAITVGSGAYTFSGQHDATRCIMIIGQNYETINNSAGSAYSYTANPEGVTIDISADL